MPIFRDERTYSFSTNLSKTMGRHDIRGGYGMTFLYLNHWQPELDNPRGRFDFTTRSVAALARRSADEQLLQPVGELPARIAGHRQQERSVPRR